MHFSSFYFFANHVAQDASPFQLTGFIGQCFGEASKNFFDNEIFEEAIKDIAKVSPVDLDMNMVVESTSYDCEEHTHHKRVRTCCLRELAEELQDDIIEYYRSGSFQKWNDFVNLVQDSYSNGDTFLNYFLTPEEYERKEQEARRKELEGIAAQFAQKCKFPVGSMEFLEALNEAIDYAQGNYEDYNNPERQMEEWMDHRYAGSSSYFHENVNYTRSKLYDEVNTLQDVWDWLEENCPLLICQWKEKQLVEV